MIEPAAAEFRQGKVALDGQMQIFIAAAQAAEEREQRYQDALKLVRWIDEQCVRGRVHFRSRAGALLRTLDEVVRAILEDQLEVGSWAN